MTGEEYRYIYTLKYNKGLAVKLILDETKTVEESLVSEGYEIIYRPIHDGDILVGKKGEHIVGVASIWGWYMVRLDNSIYSKDEEKDTLQSI